MASFHDLPPELRIMVYEYYYDGPARPTPYILQCPMLWGGSDQETRATRTKTAAQANCLALANDNLCNASLIISREAREVWFKRHMLSLEAFFEEPRDDHDSNDRRMWVNMNYPVYLMRTKLLLPGSVSPRMLRNFILPFMCQDMEWGFIPHREAKSMFSKAVEWYKFCQQHGLSWKGAHMTVKFRLNTTKGSFACSTFASIPNLCEAGEARLLDPAAKGDARDELKERFKQEVTKRCCEAIEDYKAARPLSKLVGLSKPDKWIAYAIRNLEE